MAERRRSERRPEHREERRTRAGASSSGLKGDWHGVPKWALAAGGGLGAYLLYRWWSNRSSSSTATTTTPPGSATGQAGTGSGLTGTAGAGGGGAPSPGFGATNNALLGKILAALEAKQPAPAPTTTAPPPATYNPGPLPSGGTAIQAPATGSPAGAVISPYTPSPSYSQAISSLTPQQTSAITQGLQTGSGSSVGQAVAALGGYGAGAGQAPMSVAKSFNPATARSGGYFYKSGGGYKQYVPGKSNLARGTQLFTAP